MRTLKGYLLYEPHDAQKNTGFIELFMEESKRKGVTLSLLLTTDERLLPLTSHLSLNSFSSNNQMPSAPAAHTGTDQLCADTLENPDFIINRSRIPALSRTLERCGIHVFNSAKVCEICNDKRRTYEYLKEYGIPSMDTVYPENPADGSAAREFGYPFVLKPAGGHGGRHVGLIRDERELHEALSALKKDYGIIPKLVFQRCASDIGKELRVYVLGGKIIAGMMRVGADPQSQKPEIRANFSLGGTASLHVLTKEETALTEKISAALPADLVGIDFIYHNGRPIFNEIEDVVGTRMLYANTHIDIVKEYLAYVVKICCNEGKG